MYAQAQLKNVMVVSQSFIIFVLIAIIPVITQCQIAN